MNTMETLTYFNIIAVSIFTWYTADADTNQTAITNISVVITFIQLVAVILYHTYKHMNQKLFSTIQESLICIKIKEIVSQKQQERINHKLVSADENILLDMINRPTNTDNIPQDPYQPTQSLNPNEPTQSIVELPQSQQSPPSPPEATHKEPERECEQQVSVEQDGVYIIKNQSLTTDKNEQCIDSNMVQSSHVVHPFPTELQEEGGCHCVTVEVKIHNY